MSQNEDTGKVGLTRMLVGGVVGLSTNAVAKAVIKNNVADPETTTQKVALAVGSTVLGQMVGFAAADYVDGQIMRYKRAFKDGIASGNAKAKKTQ